MSEEQPNLHLDPGESFFSDGVSVVFREGQIVLDFKKTSPRVDDIGGSQEQTVVINHQPIILQPQMAKILLNVLQQNIAEYENRFGEITVPEQQDEEADTPDPQEHSYIG
jgi:hypothetical protein